jgi:ribosome-associated protein
MDKEVFEAWLENEAEMSFSRSSGPGGQNVNKLNTKASLFVPIASARGLSEADRARLEQKLSGKLAEGGVLVIQVQDTRSQLQNREIAVERAIRIIEGALKREKPRRPTKPTRASKERRLLRKKLVKQRKEGRAAGRRGTED